MEKKIQEYLHLYIGCKALLLNYDGDKPKSFTLTAYNYNYYRDWWADIRPLLRPLSSMTEEEAVELIKITAWKHYGGHPHERKYETYKNSFGQIVVSWGLGAREKNVPVTKEAFYPEEITHLLSRGFDLFGLIDAGLAIDKTLHPSTIS